jgi:altronate hydrolase
VTFAKSIILAEADNVAVATDRIGVGESLPGGAKAMEAIERGQKVALRPIAAGAAVVKYAQAIGRAT